MSIKTLQKQLFAAIAMVLVATMALGSSTYAWFANNNVVEAKGLEINAQAEGKLLIIAQDSAGLADKKTSTTYSLSTGEGDDLFPTHYDVTSKKWVHNFSDTYDKAISGDSTETDLTTLIGASSTDAYTAVSDFYLNKSMWVAVDQTGAGADPIKFDKVAVKSVTIETDATTLEMAELIKCARVTMIVGDTAYTFATEGQVTTEPSADGTTKAAFTAIDATTGVAIKTGWDGSALEIPTYVYFDGRDARCTSENFDASAVKVTVVLMGLD